MAMLSMITIALLSGSVLAQNGAPIFEKGGDMSNLVLPETTKINSQVYTLKATDPENERVYYLIDGDQFKVDRFTGRVFLSQPLDYELVRQIKVIVTATDGRSKTPNHVTVQVEDYNDEVPTFSEQTYQKTVKENAPVGTVILDKLSVDDKDIVNDQLSVTCMAKPSHIQIYGDVCNIFKVVTTKVNNLVWVGQLILNYTLDYEAQESYQVPLVAFDGRNNQSKSVEVRVLDIQDTPPRFTRAAAATIDENISLTKVVTTVSAVDGDKSSKREIVYEIWRNPGNCFKIDSYSGAITARKIIDREDPLFSSGYIDITLKARELISKNPYEVGQDRLTTAQTTIRINVNDVNDNRPEFDQRRYDVSIPEDIPSGRPLSNLIITITDRDQKYAFKPSLSSRYDILLQNFNDTFEVFPAFGRATTVASIRVRDTSLIDYDGRHKFYDLRLLARESDTMEHLSSASMVRVTVLDVNDLFPVFDRPNYKAKILETARAGYRVIDVTATDADTNKGGTAGIVYELLGNGAELFNIVSTTGYVTVRSCGTPGSGNCINYEQTTQYHLSVSATDDEGNGNTATTDLFIDIIDENDNWPVSNQPKYYGTIEERSLSFIGRGVTIKATDADANSTITYSIFSNTGPKPGLFHIDSASGVMTGNRNEPILYKYSNDGGIIVTVRISDGKHSSTATVDVRVIDVNDAKPVFDIFPYKASIPETTTGVIWIMDVKATDADSPTTAAGVFIYSIESGSLEKFEINPQNGTIHTTSSAKFDFDVQNEYKMQVHASDKGSPALTGTTIVIVDILDANNRNPVFPRDPETEEVYENAGLGMWVITVYATDSDANSQLKYSMRPKSARKPSGDFLSLQEFDYTNLFRINSATGNVTVNQALDRDIVAKVTYTIKATDVSAGTLQTGTADLIITILDINDKPPIFRKPSYHITIDEEMSNGQFVGVFTADDPDGFISRYEIINDIGNYFSIQTSNGHVAINKRIDYDAFGQSNLQFSVRAYDSGIPELSSTAFINVTIRNINDNRPQFKQTTYSFSIPEDLRPGSPIDQANNRIIATDKDLSPCSGFSFSLESAGSIFVINPVSGKISLGANVKLDRETFDHYNIDVLVRDTPCKPNGTVHENSAPVSVTITDINDNNPKFTKSLYSVTVLETLIPGASIVTVSATDDDISDLNALTFSKVLGLGDPNNLFTVSSSGLVISQASLKDQEGVHTFGVEVRDNYGVSPYLNNKAQVAVTVLEVSNNFPEWIHPTEGETVDVLEEQYLGMLVYDCHAIDRDGGENGRITYGIHVDGKYTVATKEFRINPVTGVIRTERVFDCEERDQYSLLLVARDNGRRRKETTRILSIRIRDVNDHLPVFRAPRVKACTMAEDKAAGKVCEVKATDADINDTIKYTIRARNDNPPLFAVDTMSGVISLTKPLPEGHLSLYSFEVEATNDKADDTVVRSRSRRAESPNVMSVNVEVVDKNDHSPTFITNNPHICVSSRVNLQSLLYKMIATDKDKNDRLTYSIRSVSRVKSFAGNLTIIFSIARDDGVIMNELLLGFHNGMVFYVNVDVTDSVNRDTTQSKIFVSDDASAVALVVKQPRESVVEIAPFFQEILSKSLSKAPHYNDTIVCISHTKSHVTSSGTVNDQWSDVYLNAFGLASGSPSIISKANVTNSLNDVLNDPDRQKDLLSFNVDNVRSSTQADTVAWTRPLLIVVILVCILIVIAIMLLAVCCYQYFCSSKDDEREEIIGKDIKDDTDLGARETYAVYDNQDYQPDDHFIPNNPPYTQVERDSDVEVTLVDNKRL